ncbi:MAG: Rrf2 family transcriptional regulator [Candidatus Omnitrophica bacterium]|nr:Rrf2 family transcriptional regulator [Candidatus Omnitrophota bacterium]
MKISTKTQYGVRAMLEIARHTDREPISIHDISRQQALSVSYLEQLLNKLRKAGLVKSVRGPKGGYLLSRQPKKIKISEIVTVLEGDIGPVFCVAGGKKANFCDRLNKCASKALWKKMRDAMMGVLESTTLGDLCEGATDKNIPA